MKLDFAAVVRALLEAKDTGYTQFRIITGIYSFVGGENTKYQVKDIAESHASQVMNGRAHVRQKIANGAFDPKIMAAMPGYVEKSILPHLRREKCGQLVDDLLRIIRSDSQIGITARERMERFAADSAISDFIAEVILYALQSAKKDAIKTESKNQANLTTSSPNHESILAERKEKGLPIVEKSGYINRRLVKLKANGEPEGNSFSETDILNHLGKITCIVAEGGLGKTTLTQNLRIALGELCHWASCLPCAKVLGKNCNFSDLIPTAVRILILDGFDEIVDSIEKSGLLSNLKIHLEQTDIQVIFTMRTIADADYVKQELGEAVNFSLLPFSNNDCIALVRQYMPNDEATAFLELIGLSPWDHKKLIQKAPLPASELCNNPFYLTKLISVFQETGNIPETRGSLFKNVLEYTLSREKQLAGFSLNNLEHKFTIKRLYSILTEFAVRIFNGTKDEFALSILESIFGEYNQVDDPHLYATQLLEYLTARGLLESGQFIHQLLLEYLTALWYWNTIKRKNFSVEYIQNLFNHLPDDRWETVIQLFISIVENEACEKDKDNLYIAIFNLGFANAFRHSDIQRIHIPGSIKSLPNFMFYNCKRLETVVVEEGVEKVSIMTFNGCLRLTELKIPKSVVSLFYKHPCDGASELGLPNLKRIYLPRHLGYVMKDDDRVVVYDAEPITLPDTTEIANHAFRGKHLETYQIGEGITSIGSYAFANCTELKEITIPETVNMLGNNCFDGCSALKSIDIPDSVKSIGKEAFRDCLSLSTVCLPKDLKQIPQDAFSTTNIHSIQLPRSCETVCKRAFADCGSLKDIRFPNSLVSIEMSAFWFCFGLSLLDLSSCSNLHIIGSSAFFGCDALTFVHLPDGLQEIRQNAFRSCANLSEITIPKSVKIIGQGAFLDCNLKTVRISRKFEHQIEDIFGKLDPEAVQFVD